MKGHRFLITPGLLVLNSILVYSIQVIVVQGVLCPCLDKQSAILVPKNNYFY
ncbi:hypothetical protein [Candidatus Kuenenia sp.]|uniref:hypothetical protein n=1 Tax=Candidatus Kuenenia sp. TaxID=2499824 RepID=UPI003220282D